MLDRPNITYFVIRIIKLDFEKLDYFVTPTTPLTAILKTIIFDNNIDMTGKIAIYLQGQLSARLCNKTNMLIQIFSVNLIVELQTQFLKDFCYGNICI